MSKLYITEYKGVRQVEGGLSQVGEEPGVDQTAVTFTTAVASDPFGAGTKVIRVISDGNCHLVFGTGPTETVNNKLVIANSVEYFGVIEGQKVSAIDAAP